MSDMHPCAMCKGTGRVPLSGIYADTLALLRKYRNLCGADLAAIARCNGSAMCNRLAALEKMGFATSTRYGRQRLWKAK
jgi:hypothetical protein